MNNDLEKHELIALESALKEFDAPVAGDRLQNAILTDFDRQGPKQRPKLVVRRFIRQCLAPAGAVTALSLAGLITGIASVGAPVPAQEEEAYAYLADAFETALLGEAAESEDMEIWHEF